MSEATHTPGKWVFGDWVNNKRKKVDGAGWIEVWTVSKNGEKSLPFVSCRHQDEFANARLIAAAPDLLSDLRKAATTLRQYERLHRAKNTDESTAKANVNATLAARFEVTIAKATQ